MNYYLAIDIGASSGRHILGSVKDGKISLEEIYRFENEIKKENGSLIWDIDTLLREVKKGLSVAKDLGKIPTTVAIDTWGVDYVLLDENMKEILPCVCYRDSARVAAVDEVMKILPQEELYRRTGTQKQSLNTVYQLYADKISGKLDGARHFLMMPDYLSYKLTGVMKNEYTNATTTNLVNAEERCWDEYILDTLGIPKEIFKPLSLPCEPVGCFTDEVAGEVGFNATVILSPTHDTASAVAACPLDSGAAYISSGTWSLVGTEILSPCTSREAMDANFTNEGGVEYRFRFIKNIMGMWLFQGIRKDINKSLSYDDMMHMAMESSFRELIDPTDAAFAAPESMTEAVRSYLGKPDLPLADVLASIYHSLAASYKKTVSEIEEISGKRINKIIIVGGGSKDTYLNRLTALYTDKKVYTGLKEGTATGNLLSQIMYQEKISLDAAREIVKNTFTMEEFDCE